MAPTVKSANSLPADIAGACLYLASDLSAFMTGATLDVNGGAYMR